LTETKGINLQNTYEPLDIIAQENPVACAEYAGYGWLEKLQTFGKKIRGKYV
jgi:hypothetical protein